MAKFYIYQKGRGEKSSFPHDMGGRKTLPERGKAVRNLIFFRKKIFRP